MTPRNESSEIAQAFPGAVVDLYGGAELAAQLAANRTGATPEPGSDAAPDILAGVAAAAAAEQRGVSWETAQEAARGTKELFAQLLPSVEVPELAELRAAGIDFERLETGFEAYEAAGMEPMLVIAPVNLPLDKWRDMYTNLQAWQEAAYPEPPQGTADPLQGRRLKRQTDGNGLYINPNIEPVWDDLNQQAVDQTPGASFTGSDGIVWKALVVPAASREDGGLAVNTSHDLSTRNLDAQLNALGLAPNQVNQQDAHMPIGTYLTLQAERFASSGSPIDSNTWTWNAGTFTSGGLRAPASVWGPGYGLVYVDHDVVDDSGDFVGARLPVWG